MIAEKKEKRYKYCKYLIVWLILVFFADLEGQAQNAKIDSLKAVVQDKNSPDSDKVKALSVWDGLIYRTDPELDEELNGQIDSIAQLNLDKDLDSNGRKFFLRARSHALNNKGIVLKKKGDFSGALECYLISMEIKKELGNLAGVSNSSNNIGNLYMLQKEYELAAEFIQQALDIRTGLKDSIGMAECYNNLASVRRGQGRGDLALEYYQKSDKLYQQLGVLSEQSLIAVSNIGVYYSTQDDLRNEAMVYYIRALKGAEKIGSTQSMAVAHKNIGILYFDQKKYQKAIKHAQLAVDYCKEIQEIITAKEAYHTLYRSYQELGNSSKALHFYEQYVTVRDSISSSENERSILQYKYRYLYEKKANEDRLRFVSDSLESAKTLEMKDTQLALQESEISRRNYQMGFLVGGLFLIIMITGVVYQRLRVTRMQNELIEKQKRLDLSLVISDNKMRKEFNEQLLDKLEEFGSLNGEALQKALGSFQLDVRNQLHLEDRLEHASENLDQLHSQFDTNLKERFPSLTKSEREVCHLIRLGMSIKEIANHRNSTIGAVKSIRHRIKSKLPVGEENLDLYIREMT